MNGPLLVHCQISSGPSMVRSQQTITGPLLAHHKPRNGSLNKEKLPIFLYQKHLLAIYVQGWNDGCTIEHLGLLHSNACTTYSSKNDYILHLFTYIDLKPEQIMNFTKTTMTDLTTVYKYQVYNITRTTSFQHFFYIQSSRCVIRFVHNPNFFMKYFGRY